MNDLFMLSLFHRNLGPSSIIVFMRWNAMSYSVSSSHGLGEGLLLPSEAMKGLRYDAIALAILAHLLGAAQERFQLCHVRWHCAVPDMKQIFILGTGMFAIDGVVVE